MDSHATLGPQRLADIFGQRASFYVPPAQARVRCQCPSHDVCISSTRSPFLAIPVHHVLMRA